MCVVVIQPGPKDFAIQCFIKRNKKNSMFYLYLGLTPSKLILISWLFYDVNCCSLSQGKWFDLFFLISRHMIMVEIINFLFVFS